MYKVRFHLAKGKNYMSWQVSHIGKPTGLRAFKQSVGYYDPNSAQLIMYNCKLNNVSKVAEKIFSGSNKTVCAWIACEDVDIVPVVLSKSVENLDNIEFNPRKRPYWSFNESNIDGNKYNCLLTKGNKVYIKNE